MPSSQLKRAEKAIAAIREQSELPPVAAEALEEIVAAIRTGLPIWSAKKKPTERMALPPGV